MLKQCLEIKARDCCRHVFLVIIIIIKVFIEQPRSHIEDLEN